VRSPRRSGRTVEQERDKAAKLSSLQDEAVATALEELRLLYARREDGVLKVEPAILR
jgi:hypothetical protein